MILSQAREPGSIRGCKVEKAEDLDEVQRQGGFALWLGRLRYVAMNGCVGKKWSLASFFFS